LNHVQNNLICTRMSCAHVLFLLVPMHRLAGFRA
jgi:hypothetical protein